MPTIKKIQTQHIVSIYYNVPYVYGTRTGLSVPVADHQKTQFRLHHFKITDVISQVMSKIPIGSSQYMIDVWGTRSELPCGIRYSNGDLYVYI